MACVIEVSIYGAPGTKVIPDIGDVLMSGVFKGFLVPKAIDNYNKNIFSLIGLTSWA